ncbi:MAG TPA: nucleotidyltransferase family protein [Gammaproteobacteria bacterium]|nr:nucleotidyltransferase family protein [Gammaproteobacteria bacterium]
MTRAILLSAGRGERLRPLTDSLPKALIPVKNKALIIHQLEKLSSIGIKEVVINISHLADKIRDTLGDGKKFNLKIMYSYEPELLETGGGIFNALSLLGNDPFLVISSDIYTDYPYEKLVERAKGFNALAHLILVPNPDYNTKGDFSLDPQGLIGNDPEHTYANIALCNPDLFKGSTPGRFRLAPLFREAAERHLVTGELYQGLWHNVGTVEELSKIES